MTTHASTLSSYEEAMSLFPSCDRHIQHQELSKATALDIGRLQRIRSVTIERQVMRDAHRYFVISVARQSAHPIQALSSTSTYVVRQRNSHFRQLRTQLLERAQQACASTKCAICQTFIDMLTHDHAVPSRMLPVSAAHECTRLERFLSAVLDHAVLYAASNAIHCVGCEWMVLQLAAFLKQPYFPSTGLL